MYLTRLVMNPARRGTRVLLASPQRLHAAVLASFPPDTPTSVPQGRLLWRVDRSERVDLYVASPERPDLTHLIEQAGWPTTGTWVTRDYGPLLKRLETGQHWAFRLTANPVRSTRSKDGEPTKPRGHVTAAQQENWLLSRTERHGFRVCSGVHDTPDLVLRDRTVARFSRRNDAGHDGARAGQVVIAMATYEGMLEICDPDALRAALTHGIGRAKGYGCGLLTLARPS